VVLVLDLNKNIGGSAHSDIFREKKRHGSIDPQTPIQSPPNATNRTEVAFQKLVKLDVYIFVAISYSPS